MSSNRDYHQTPQKEDQSRNTIKLPQIATSPTDLSPLTTS